MAGINGSSVKITIGVDPVAPATTISEWKGISEEVSVNFDVSVAKIGVTSKYNNGFEENLPGLITGEISGEANTIYVNKTGFYNHPDLLSMTLQRKVKTMRIGTGNAGDPTYEFKGFFTKFSNQAEMEAAGKASFDISMTSVPTLVA